MVWQVSKTELIAQEQFAEPIIQDAIQWTMNHGILGRKFKKAAVSIVDHLKELKPEEAMQLNAQLDKGDVVIKTCKGDFTIDRDMAEAKKVSKKVLACFRNAEN